MQADPRAVEEIVLPQSERMGPCQRSHPAIGTDNRPYHKDGTSCTGQVAEFPMLRQPCKGRHGIKEDPNIRYGYPRFVPKSCDDVGCRGWLPVTTTDALLEAGKRYGFWLNWSEALKHWVVAEANLLLGLKVVGTGETPNLALALALEAAQKQEVEK